MTAIAAAQNERIAADAIKMLPVRTSRPRAKNIKTALTRQALPRR
jgi:hypothetical protein